MEGRSVDKKISEEEEGEEIIATMIVVTVVGLTQGRRGIEVRLRLNLVLYITRNRVK